MIEYTIRPRDSLVSIARRFDRSLEDLLVMNRQFRGREHRIRVGEILRLPDVGEPVPQPADGGAASPADGHAPTADPLSPASAALPGRSGAGGGIEDTLRERVDTDRVGDAATLAEADERAAEADDTRFLRVPHGQLTFDAEGLDDEHSPWFSRRLHVPSESSGITVGRGYDMKMRSEEEVERDLRQAGVDADAVRMIKAGAGLSGAEARRFIADPALAALQISRESQYHLFLHTYEILKRDVLRICAKDDVVRKYGVTDWHLLDARVRDVVVDLRFRGDYHPRSRQRIQPTLTGNDLAEFRSVMIDRDYWSRVPRDRFERRRNYLA